MAIESPPKLQASVPPDFTLESMNERLKAGHQAVLEAAHLLDGDAPNAEEEEDHAAYVNRLQRLFEISYEEAVQAANKGYSCVTEVAALPWSPTWFPTRVAGNVYGLSKQAVAYKDANEHCAQSVEFLAQAGLYQAAWFKANDSLYFAGKYFETALEMAKLGLES